MPSYVQVVSDTEVIMAPPPDSAAKGARARPAASPATRYTFTHVFPPPSDVQDDAARAQAQSEFFETTTLPLVQELLHGKSSLLFAYGVTNSGKTYTVQGDGHPARCGVLPRALRVLFSSIHGRASTKPVRPCGLTRVQPGVSDVIQSLLGQGARRGPRGVPTDDEPGDDLPPLPVDDNYRYSVWLSYAELYNERLYDLLDAPLGAARSARDDDAAARAPLTRRPLLLKTEMESGGKYVAGLKDVKVTSWREAREVLQYGQDNRSVFGTLANQASSRSHSIFTVKLVREYVGADRMRPTFSVARLSVVDLAGSERVASTEISGGPRLREAGSINKSLMCLGQCVDAMRRNQARVAAARQALDRGAASPGPRLSIVPFRHSKLTELLQPFFMGDGKVVMIVQVDPYGAGFEENAHVMRFSARAKEVDVPSRAAAPSRSASAANMSLASAQGSVVESDDASDDDAQRGLVQTLLAENEILRQRCERAESRLQVVEKSVRDEMAQYMAAALKKMQDYYEQQLQDEVRAVTDPDRCQRRVCGPQGADVCASRAIVGGARQ